MDQRPVSIYTESRSPGCWRARRLLARKGYAVTELATRPAAAGTSGGASGPRRSGGGRRRPTSASTAARWGAWAS
jgi:hypothetical protein